jgi:Flagellar hook-length control protein FliK
MTASDPSSLPLTGLAEGLPPSIAATSVGVTAAPSASAPLPQNITLPELVAYLMVAMNDASITLSPSGLSLPEKLTMDISNLQLPALLLPNGPSPADGLLLQLNKTVTAQVVEVQTLLNSVTLNIGGNNVNVSLPPQAQISPGQLLSLQVVKLLPQPVFQLLSDLSANPGAKAPAANNMPSNLQFSVLTTAPRPEVAGTVANSAPVGTNNARPLAAPSPANTPTISAQITAINGKQITLQWQAPAPPNQTETTPTSAAVTQQIRLAPGQWQLAPPGNPAAPVAQQAAATPSPAASFSVGQTVLLQLNDNAAPGQAKILITPAPVTSLPDQLIRDLLPIQNSPVALLQHLTQMPPTEQLPGEVGDMLKQLARALLQSLPTSTQLSQPENLKQSIAQSGLFLESKLAALLNGQSNINLPDDLKLKLGKLVEWLQNTPLNNPGPEASRSFAELPQALKNWLQETGQHAQSALAKITLDQLNSLPKEENSKQQWSLEIPFLHDNHIDRVQIEIERERDNNREKPEQQQNWAVSITITPPNLATIQCRIAYYNQTINTRFWSESANTVAAINQHLDVLKQQFAAHGLESGFMEAHQDKHTKSPLITPTTAGLIREKA